MGVDVTVVELEGAQWREWGVWFGESQGRTRDTHLRRDRGRWWPPRHCHGHVAQSLIHLTMVVRLKHANDAVSVPIQVILS